MRKPLHVARVVTGRQSAGRGLTVFPDDIYIVSYPRSGNNWARFLIGNLIDPKDPVTFATLERRVPEIYFSSDRALRALNRPRVFKSHEVFDPRYSSVIYIVRDPRDVAVSNYHHNLTAGNIPLNYPLEDFVPRFIDGQFDRKWGSWQDHVLSWISTRANHPGFVLVRYEDLKAQSTRELSRIAALLAHSWKGPLASSVADLERAVQLSSPERMRALEIQQGRRWIRSHADRGKRPYVAVREAVSGSWKTVLSRQNVAQIEKAFGGVMQTLGYSLGSQPAEVEAVSVSSSGTGLR